jgi:hypothetical protein
MQRSIVLIALLIAAIMLPVIGPASAGEVVKPSVVKPWRYNNHSQELPFPRGERASAVWALGACWSECGSYCAWGVAACLTHDAQGHCLQLGDKCDRYCQRSCRGNAGPMVPIEFVWD